MTRADPSVAVTERSTGRVVHRYRANERAPRRLPLDGAERHPARPRGEQAAGLPVPAVSVWRGSLSRFRAFTKLLATAKALPSSFWKEA
jgi:hypothetical protein